MTRDYPEEDADAPLVPFIATETDPSDDEIRGLRRDIAALRAQLERMETRMEEER